MLGRQIALCPQLFTEPAFLSALILALLPSKSRDCHCRRENKCNQMKQSDLQLPELVKLQYIPGSQFCQFRFELCYTYHCCHDRTGWTLPYLRSFSQSLYRLYRLYHLYRLFFSKSLAGKAGKVVVPKKQLCSFKLVVWSVFLA
jgi:hypothetical protein